jgi:transketolase
MPEPLPRASAPTSAAPVALAEGARHRDMANAIRVLAMDAVERANSGHPGMPMGMADVATVLFTRHLKYDPSHPAWPDRDRFVLSAGHGSMLLYALLYLTGYPDIGIEDLKNFRQLGSRTAGHPEHGHAAGIETTTGPLGQGLANSVGMAIAERSLNARFGNDLVDHRVWVIAGDGCLMEGISEEAISLAGHLRLNRLIVLWDDNRISIDGPTDLSTSEDQIARFRAAGWATLETDGHDPLAIDRVLTKAQESDRPVIIACRTNIGHGAPSKAGTAACHGSPLGAAEIEGARSKLEWPHAAFELPDPILDSWRAAGAAGTGLYAGWSARLDHAPAGLAREFTRAVSGALPEGFAEAILKAKAAFAEKKPKIATRQASGEVLDMLMPAVPELLGGSADLTGSNNTKAKQTAVLSRENYAGRYIHYGVREHGMAAAMNGMALHGGIIPFGGTFLAFADYSRPAIRLAALMRQRVVHVMTHDSIGLGEDGPTHQPVEHLAALRAIPGLYVFRPADAIETAECWALALTLEAPSVLALTRQSVPALRGDATAENKCARGGYVLADATGTRRVTIMATGSEVQLAMAARAALEKDGIGTAVVSLPCWQLFDSQDAAYRAKVLGAGARIAIEAAIGFGWERYIGPEGGFVGMTGFGASAPAEELYRHFGITAEAAVAAAKARL